MHDRADKPTGAVTSAAAMAIESMILLNIDLRIAQVRPRVEKSVQRIPAPTHGALLSVSDGHALGPPLRQRTLQPIKQTLQPAKPSLLRR
jgi:hypothetical protein